MHQLSKAETAAIRNAQRLCPTSKGTTALHLNTKDAALFAVGCRSWACPACGPAKKRQLVQRIVKAKPSAFVTLSCRHEGTPQHQHAKIARALPRVIATLRKTLGLDIEYFRMLEECKDGYPHFHLLARTAYIPQKTLSEEWEKQTGASVVDIRKAHGKSTKYVAKYISKARDKTGSWTRQRCSVTRRFWAKDDDTEQEWIDWQWMKMSIYEAAQGITQHHSLEELRKGTWWLRERTAGDEIPEAITTLHDKWD